MTAVRVAAAAWQVRAPASLAAWQDDVASRLGEARGLGAQVAVVPEYASLELTALVGGGDDRAQLAAVQAFLPDYVATYAELARRLGLYVLAGSFPERDADGRIRNRARLFGPDGGAGVVTKRQLTRFEQGWDLAPGDDANVFATDLGLIGVSICYDAEFPLLARRQCEAGARLILVPSCTDALTGYWRVRIASQARALENQCFVAQAPTVGAAAWCTAIDENHGAAGIFGPPDLGFPTDGIVALGSLDHAGWVIADCDLDLVERVRTDGAVQLFRDWALPRHLAGPVTVVPLR